MECLECIFSFGILLQAIGTPFHDLRDTDRSELFMLLHMKSVDDLLKVVKQKFPRQDNRIDQLYDKDSDFRSLCEDYLACLQSIEKYKKVSAEKQQSIKDFEGALNDLEKELYDFIFP